MILGDEMLDEDKNRLCDGPIVCVMKIECDLQNESDSLRTLTYSLAHT